MDFRHGWKTSAIASAAALLSMAAFPMMAMSAEEERETWRLFVADHSKPLVTAVDLASGKSLSRFDLKGFAALSASSSGEAIFAVQGDADIVQVLKSGISLSDHGEHRDVEISDPALSPVTFEGKRPSHLVAHDGKSVLFYDRGGKADIIDERALIDGKSEIRSIDTTAAHHGVAVTMGAHVLVSVPDTKAEIKPDELPPRLGLRVLDADGSQVGDVATCTGLHGEATSARLVGFGCAEGVLIARPVGLDGPKLQMLPYDPALPKQKVSTLLGGRSMQFFLGNFGEDKLVLIDPEAEKPYRLVELPTRRIDFALDPARVKNAYILTEDGNLHLLDVLSGTIEKNVTVTEPYSKDGHWRDPRPRLAVAGNTIAVTDPRHGLIRIIDIDSFAETKTIAVEGMPFSIVAVGGSGMVH